MKYIDIESDTADYYDLMSKILNIPYIRAAYKGEIAIDLPYSQAKEIIEWCSEMFGVPGYNRSKHLWRVNYATQSRIYLRRPDHEVLFRLRWM